MSSSHIKRTNSDDNIDNKEEDAHPDANEAGKANLNTQWVHFRLAHISYVIAIFVVWFTLQSMTCLWSIEGTCVGLIKKNECWTITNVIHGIFSFAILHWVKGSPDEETQGVYNNLTLYEQIQYGKPWTKTKKFLMFVPTFLAYRGCHESKFGIEELQLNGQKAIQFQLYPIIVNCGIFLIMIIAKIPEMHKVRIFGVNSSPTSVSLPSGALKSPASSNKLKDT